jgi:hypothetical protein
MKNESEVNQMKVPELSGPLMDKAVEEARRLIAFGETSAPSVRGSVS